jgi:hypothetical protein
MDRWVELKMLMQGHRHVDFCDDGYNPTTLYEDVLKYDC